MFKRFLHFITYNNAFVLIVLGLMSGAGVTLAADPAVQAAIIDTHEEVRSIDNTYLLSTDLDVFNPQMQIKGVIEDDDFYYVTYSYTAIEIRDYVWGSFEKEGLLKVGKGEVQGKDLGLFVAEELGEIVDGTLAYLKEVKAQEEKNGPSLKVVTTEYSGLIGRMLDPVDKEFPGYVPVVEKVATVIAAVETPADTSSGSSSIADQVVQALADSRAGAPDAPVITLLGNNPARIPKGSSFIDFGATAEDNKDSYVLIEVLSNTVDTEKIGTYSIVYTAKDSDGNTAKPVTRKVEVYDDGFETIIAPPEEATSTPETVPEAVSEKEPKSAPAASSTPETVPEAVSEKEPKSAPAASSTPSETTQEETPSPSKNPEEPAPVQQESEESPKPEVPQTPPPGAD